jgi:hypothetical protein
MDAQAAAMRLPGARLLLLAAPAAALLAGCIPSWRDRPPYYVLFTHGRPSADLEVSYTAASIRSEPEGDYLALESPGTSTLSLTFPLRAAPDRLYVLLDWRADRGDAVYTLRANGDRVDQRVFQWSTFMTLGVDIAKHCREGQNTVELSLEPGSSGLSVRGAMISDTPSLLDNARRIHEKQSWSARRLMPIFIGIGILILIPLAVSAFRRMFSGSMSPIPYRASLAAFLFGALAVAFAWFCVRPLFWATVGLFAGIVLLVLISLTATRRPALGPY